MHHRIAIVTSALLLAVRSSPAALQAQQVSLVYRLGNDTVAVEQYTRTATLLAGEMVQRSGPMIARIQYQVSIGRGGRPTGATLKRLQADGTAAPNSPTETRLSVTADSLVREIVWPDSVQRRAFAAKNGLLNFPTFIYGPTELLAGIRRAGGSLDSVPALGAAGGIGFTGLAAVSPATSPPGTTAAIASSVRLRGGAYAMELVFDARDRLQSVDGTLTTNKAMATRGNGGLDLPAMARTMTPTGVLSARATARAAFGPGGMVLIDYGRPLVRERTVWGGTLVPFDSVWRAGANDATHLFTTRTLTLGSLTLVPGMYTLWVQHTRTGTFLIVNKQTGQWGTQYDATQDLGRVELAVAATPAHVEEFTITLRALGSGRGAIEMAWDGSIASVGFGVMAGR